MSRVHAALIVALCLVAMPGAANTVKITPVGSHPGEHCGGDRAMIFEDPTGVRILYDTGRTVTGGDDPRLGDIHLVLLSHAHGDHIGDQKLKAIGTGGCSNPEFVTAAPNSTTAEVVAAKNAAIVTNVEMSTFIARKVQNIRGKPVGVCPPSGDGATVPLAAPCRSNTHLGGVFNARAPNATQGVEITIVFSSHSNNVPHSLLSETLRASLAPDDTSIVLGPPIGYVIKFTNGLVVYLSGDTGVHTEMKTVVSDYHKANLAVLNLGTTFGTFLSGTHAMNDLVRPASVILTHTGEVTTEGGKLRPGSRTAALAKQLKAPAYPAVSGRTMEFDGQGKCVAGC